MPGAHALSTLPWAIVLSAIALFLTWRAYRQAVYARAVRWGGWAAIVWAVWLVGLMRLVVRIGSAVADWAAGFVFRPTVWLGLAVGVVGVLLVVTGTVLGRRTGKIGAGKKERRPEQVEESAAAPRKRGKPAATADDDMSDIEAILKKHGIE